jgi:hypothetical protein
MSKMLNFSEAINSFQKTLIGISMIIELIIIIKKKLFQVRNKYQMKIQIIINLNWILKLNIIQIFSKKVT